MMRYKLYGAAALLLLSCLPALCQPQIQTDCPAGTVPILGPTGQVSNQATGAIIRTMCVDFNGNLTYPAGGTHTGTEALTRASVSAGISQGAGFKHQRFGATCTTAAAAGATCTTTYSWTSAFADASYTVSCDGATPTGTPSLAVNAAPVAASVTVVVTAITAAASSYGAVHCIAVHD